MKAWQKNYDSNDSDKSQKIGDIFIKIGPFLLMYTEYIKEFDKSNSMINDTYAKNPKFKAVMEDIQVSYVANNYWNFLIYFRNPYDHTRNLYQFYFSYSIGIS